MIEKTVVRVVQLPEDQDWAWHPDLNIIELSDRLDEAGLERALQELANYWRRHYYLRVVS